MSNSNASIVTKTYLILNEVDAEGGVVPVTLGKASQQQTPTGAYPGLMKYQSGHVEAKIDVVQVHYSNSQSPANNVSLQVTLADSVNYFVGENPVKDSQGNPPPYVTSQTLSGDVSGNPNTVTLSYSQPEQSSSAVINELFFNTAQGIIDPDEQIDRDPH